MSLKEQLQQDIKNAMKGGLSDEVAVLRMVVSAAHNKEIEKGEPLDEAGFIAVLMGEAKKRKESALAFENGGRPELAEKERAELVLLQRYLPKELTAEEVAKEVDLALAGSDAREFGPAMKIVMGVLRGRADAGVIQDAVKKYLGGK